MRLGIDFESAGWMLLILLRARRRVCRRGERGKLESVVMSLSVKSIASWSLDPNLLSALLLCTQWRDLEWRRRYKPLRRPSSQWPGFYVL